MENYEISIDAPIEAKNEREAIWKFRKWVAEVEASCFDVKFIQCEPSDDDSELSNHH
ncbi:hypothetical protein LCGC14_1268820 [marine sediment metagenome]|uniref:Uncharacterized protein n=1 Tax=marine sediment metagenome TaxID=412755 RepID=A0A0F9P1V2_9ZZZZ